MDSVQVTSVRVYELVVHLDEHRREQGRLPATVDPVLDRSGQAAGFDIWGHELRYTLRGAEYEVRSAGPDHLFGTPDDIIALAEFGRDRPCEVRNEYRVFRPAAVPPCTSTTSVKTDTTGM